MQGVGYFPTAPPVGPVVPVVPVAPVPDADHDEEEKDGDKIHVKVHN